MTTPAPRIPVCDLGRHHQAVQAVIQPALERVMASGWYVLGPEVRQFEQAWAATLGTGHAIGVANGTDAITLALMALGIGPGDEVITVSMTATPTAMGITSAGAIPVFCEVDPATVCMDPAALEAAITPRTAAIVPVHLYGQMAPLEAILAIAQRHGLAVIEDCAQAHLATRQGRLAGTWGDIAAWSFYPTKNLGAFGDAGACTTDDAALAEALGMLRNYGQRTRYENERIGRNARLDELQAALLDAMLPLLEGWTRRRQEIAAIYQAGLADLARDGRLVLPVTDPANSHVWHLYTVRLPGRDALRDALAARGIDAQVHYPIPVHLQPAYAGLGGQPGQFPVTEQVARETLSLPMFPELTDAEAGRVVDAVREALAG